MKIYFSLEVMRFLNISSIVYKFRDVRESQIARLYCWVLESI